jgi:hypothetical protein
MATSYNHSKPKCDISSLVTLKIHLYNVFSPCTKQKDTLLTRVTPNARKEVLVILL